VRVVGIGRLDRGDDAAGRLVVRRLRERFDAGVEMMESEGGMTELLDAWGGAPAVIAVDAVTSGAPPGTLLRFDAGREGLRFPSGGSTHGLGLAEAVELARTLGRLPHRMIVHGIEGERFEAGAALSPAVEAKLDELVERVAEETRTLLADASGANESRRS
jgi:hydrogenase maturation protease